MYIFNKEYFVSNDDDVATIGKHSFWATFDSKFSQKVLSNLYSVGKPYVSFEDDEEVVAKPKPKSKIKTKKVKIDEPKESEPEDTTST